MCMGTFFPYLNVPTINYFIGRSFSSILHLLFISKSRIIWPKGYFKQQYRSTIIRTSSCCRLIASVLVTSKQWGGDQDAEEPRVIYEDNPSTVLDAIVWEDLWPLRGYTSVARSSEYWRNLPEGKPWRKRLNPSSAIQTTNFSYPTSPLKKIPHLLRISVTLYVKISILIIFIQFLWVTIIQLWWNCNIHNLTLKLGKFDVRIILRSFFSFSCARLFHRFTILVGF